MAPPPIALAVRERIDAALNHIEERHGVRILFAVESGSRAWGFASPDSDYDVRFVYVRPLDWYLSLGRKRDVIELPIEDDLDISGWDIAKALTLLGKANPSLLEWLSSPILYRTDADAMTVLRTLADRAGHRAAARFHYRELAKRHFQAHIEDHDSVALKKYFYAIRPACALHWLRTHKHGRVPMALPDLLADLALPAGVREAVDNLLALKALSSEMGNGAPLPVLDTFIQAEIQAAQSADMVPEPNSTILAEADHLFRQFLMGDTQTIPDQA